MKRDSSQSNAVEMSAAVVRDVFDRLHAAYGPQGWWPAETPFEVIVGAILVQNTAWRNVETAIGRLKQRRLMRPRPLWRTSSAELQALIRPAGYYRIKERRLRSFLDFLIVEHRGSLARLFALETTELRRQLLALHGIGPETADSIVLYAAGRATFVVDAYARRVFERHGWLTPGATYEAIQRQFHASLPMDAMQFNEYHALLVEVGKRHCRPRLRCEGCPLQPLLPPNGPLCVASPRPAPTR